MKNLVATIVTSALVATVAGAVFNAWLESRKSKNTTRFDALSAAVALEGYALTCAQNIVNHNLADSSDGGAGSYLSSIPDLPGLVIVAGFLHPKKASVADRLMIFPQEAEQANQHISFWLDVTADREQTREVAVEQVADIGLKALLLAEDLRKAFRLPTRKLTFGKFDARETLEDQNELSAAEHSG